MTITVRAARFPDDLPAVLALSPPPPEGIKNVVDFDVYPTLVAEDDDGTIIGYTQFSLGPDKILHSLALRVARKGEGIGTRLMEHKVALARGAGANMHMYAVAHDGEPALKKIVERLGMHPCQRRGELVLYMQDLTEPGGS